MLWALSSKARNFEVYYCPTWCHEIITLYSSPLTLMRQQTVSVPSESMDGDYGEVSIVGYPYPDGDVYHYHVHLE